MKKTKASIEDPHLSNISVRSSSPCFGTSKLVSCRASFRLRTRESIPNTHTFVEGIDLHMDEETGTPPNKCLFYLHRYKDMKTDDKGITD